MYVLVKNLHGTSDNKPNGYASWKEFWIAKAGRSWPTYCAAQGCYSHPDVAGHVKLANGSNDWYLVPICSHHNVGYDEAYYVDSSLLVKIR